MPRSHRMAHSVMGSVTRRPQITDTLVLQNTAGADIEMIDMPPVCYESRCRSSGLVDPEVKQSPHEQGGSEAPEQHLPRGSSLGVPYAGPAHRF